MKNKAYINDVPHFFQRGDFIGTKSKVYSIHIPHFYCLEYCEDDKKMIVEMDFREDDFYLDPQLITHWEKPYDNIKIESEEKKRILLNIRDFLLTMTIPNHIIMKDM